MKTVTRISLCLSALVLASAAAQAQTPATFTLTAPRVREALIRGDVQFATGMTFDCGYWDGSTVCSTKYPAGSTVILSGGAVASGFVWDGWSGDCSGTANRCVLVMNSNKNIKANVKNIGQATIKITAGVAHGMIAGKTPAHGNDDVIQCPTGARRCSFSITNGSEMRLAPFPETGYKLGAWTGACAGQGYACNLTLNGTMEVGYTFEPSPLTFAVVAPANASIKYLDKTCTGSCSYTAPMGTKISLDLVPAAGYIIQAWGADCAGQRNPCTFALNKERMSVNAVVVKQ